MQYVDEENNNEFLSNPFLIVFYLFSKNIQLPKNFQISKVAIGQRSSADTLSDPENPLFQRREQGR